jgi:hypothetical protein
VFWPISTAACGTVMALGSVRSVTETLTNSPGQRRSCALSNIAFTAMVPELVSMVLSKKAILPATGAPVSPDAMAVTATSPAGNAWRMPGSSVCGSVNPT